VSIINSANSGSKIYLICMLYRLIGERPNFYTVDSLCSHCAPAELITKSDHKVRVSRDLGFWGKGDLRLWEVDEASQKLVLADDVAQGVKLPKDVAHHLAKKLMRFQFSKPLLSKGDEGGVGKGDEGGVAKAMLHFTLLLTQDRFAPFHQQLNRNTYESLFSEKRNLTGINNLNNNEYKDFLLYCYFLGLTEKDDAGGDYFLDPTRFLTLFLGEIFSEKKNLPSAIFLEKLADAVPILDGGVHNNAIRSEINENRKSPMELSMALSHALKRLNACQAVTLERGSDDANPLRLKLPDRTVEVITSITFNDVPFLSA